MKHKLLSLFLALVVTTALWASNVITYTATEKLPETTDTNTFGLHTNAFNVAITSHDFSNGVGTITFADDVTTIGDYAFYGCSSLTSISIPNSVTTIGEYAFYYCTGLTSVAIPNSVTTIGSMAFYGCYGLTSIAIGSSVTYIGEEAFFDCENLKTIYNNSDLHLWYGSGDYGQVARYADKIYQGFPIGDFVIKRDTILTAYTGTAVEVTIPNYITTIGEGAFDSCFGLTSITIPNSVTTIGDYAFRQCPSLISITIPNSVISIGDYVFGLCHNLTSINVDAANTHYSSVDGVLFNYAKDTLIWYPTGNTRTEYSIPNSVTTIGEFAFDNCRNLTSVTIPYSVTTIRHFAFGRCFGLTSIDVDALNTHYSSIDGVLFNYAKETLVQYPIGNTRTEYSIPNSVKTIGDYAFYECPVLTSVTIPISVTEIKEYAFCECANLTPVTIPNSVTTIGELAFYNVLNIMYNGTATGSPWGAKCVNGYVDGFLVYSDDSKTQLVSCSTAATGEVIIPNSVTTIGESAFEYCNGLTSVTIPNSVTTIGDYAFSGCPSITSVIVQWTDVNELPTMGDGVFYSIADWKGPSAATLHVPVGTTSIYQEADQWKDFGTITESYVDDETEVDMKPFITYEQPDPAFDYPYYPSWSGNTGMLRIRRDNGLQDLNLKAGVSKIVFYKTAGTTGQIWIGDPNWKQLAAVADEEGNDTKLEYVLTDYAIKCIDGDIVDGWGETAFILMGDGLEVTKIAIEIGESPFPFEFVDSQSGLTFRIIDLGEVNNVKVVSNNGIYSTYDGDIVIPSTVDYQDITFTVTEIEGRAFAYCSGLTSVTIPNSVTTIGENAFAYCSGLTSVTIPNSVTTVGDCAFYHVNNIVYDGIATGLPWDAKCVNGYVDGYLVYNDATKIALLGCSSAVTGELTIPNSVETIGWCAFEDCSGLTTVTIPNSVTTIRQRAFFSCSGLTSVTIPNSVTTIGDGAFFGCTSLTSPLYNATIFANLPTSYVGAYTIPSGIKQIAGDAFASCLALTSIEIPISITTIGRSAFESCTSLTSVIIPNSVTSIGETAFGSCSGLTSVTIQWTDVNELPTIGNYVFSAIASGVGPSEATLHVPAGTKSIYQEADQWKDFGTIIESYVDDETEVDMKPFITYEQPDPAFDYPYYPSWSGNTGMLRIFRDNGLQDLNLKAGVSKIVFYKTAGTTGQIWIGDPNWKQLAAVADEEGNDTKLEYVLTDYAIKCIDGDIVDGWGETAFILMGDGLEVTKIAIEIGESPFPFEFVDSQSGLTFRIIDLGEVNNVKVVSNNGIYSTYDGDIVIPSTVDYQDITFTVTEIEGRAFAYCSGLTSVTIPNSVTTIGDDAFSYCSGLTSVIIPNSVTTIGDNAFSGCFGLTSVIIPNSVTTIGDYAFCGCSSLTSVIIPNSVTWIGYYAFSYCSGLTSVTIPNSVTWIGDYTFAGCSALADIYSYAVNPPIAFDNTFEYVSKHCYIHVPVGSARSYQLAIGWRDFYHIVEISALPDGTTEVGVTVTNNYATFSWPVNPTASSYTLEITKDGELFCTLIFNSLGQLVGMAFAPGQGHNAPAATSTSYGYSFVVTGLTDNTTYAYTFSIRDEYDNVIDTKSGTFKTTGGTPTSVDEVHGSQPTMHKVLRNGQILLERNNATYTLMGQKVK